MQSVMINGEAGRPVHRSVRVKLILAQKPDFKIRFAVKSIWVSEFSNPNFGVPQGTQRAPPGRTDQISLSPILRTTSSPAVHCGGPQPQSQLDFGDCVGQRHAKLFSLVRDRPREVASHFRPVLRVVCLILRVKRTKFV
jgi:hypothetical protein